jgi:hypothetical protein
VSWHAEKVPVLMTLVEALMGAVTGQKDTQLDSAPDDASGETRRAWGAIPAPLRYP